MNRLKLFFCANNFFKKSNKDNIFKKLDIFKKGTETDNNAIVNDPKQNRKGQERKIKKLERSGTGTGAVRNGNGQKWER